ncbi:MAG: ATP-binding cassette domain-containing protein, partial [Desulfurococcaceae archaeon]
MSEVLKVSDLKLYYRTMSGIVRAVEDATFSLREREAIALIGESGCGKTSLARAIIRFLPRNVAELSGSVVVDGVETIGMDSSEFDRKIKWRKITYVSQAAINSLNPVIKVIDHLIEPLVVHFQTPRMEAVEKAKEIVKQVGIAEDFLWRFSFELSGG